MGVEGCTKCIKYLLFFTNFIFWLAGGLILAVALWLRHSPETGTLLEIVFDGNQAPRSFYLSVYILIAVGSVMMVVGFLGCYGAIQESQCLLGTFFACLVILFACEAAAGIWGFMHRDTVSKDMIEFYDSVYDRVVLPTVLDDSKQKTASVLKVFHETWNCCGKDQVNSLFTKLSGVITSNDVCPKGITASCHSRIKELFSNKIYLLGIAVLVVAVVMIFEMIFSMVLCCGIRNSPVY
ncbi:hypothetical protein PAMA_000092 [Pampus argenteus]